MESPFSISLPPLEELARRWGEIEPLLKRATDRAAGYEPIDLFQLRMAGRMGIWTVEKDGEFLAVIVTEIRQFPRARVLEVPFIAGRDLGLWRRDVLDMLDVHARECGCTAIMGFDRKGWARFGFEITGAVMMRKLG